MSERFPATDPIDAVALLAEPTRRGLYEHVVASETPVARDDAAAALGIGVPLAAFHLDRLVRAGLLEAEYRRRGERRGPGAGRPAKLYRRPRGTVQLSLPARRYELAAELLAESVAATGRPTLDALREAARERGRTLAGNAGVEERPRTAGEAEDALLSALSASGFEPLRDPRTGAIRLHNCPFDALAREHRDVACPMNLALLEGLADTLGGDVTAVPDDTPGFCCVRLDPIRPG